MELLAQRIAIGSPIGAIRNNCICAFGKKPKLSSFLRMTGSMALMFTMFAVWPIFNSDNVIVDPHHCCTECVYQHLLLNNKVIQTIIINNVKHLKSSAIKRSLVLDQFVTLQRYQVRILLSQLRYKGVDK